MKRAVFPGSFDPITKGHESIVYRALPLFDEIVIAVGHNSAKNASTFTFEQRVNMLKHVFGHEPKIKIDGFSGLTIDYCTNHDIHFIIRGLRTSSDFNYERSIAQMNRALNPKIDTVLIICEPEYSAISSTIIREIIKHGGDPRAFLPTRLPYADFM